ncbi:MAG: ABC transporter substrate-binding protein [Acidobacteriota bacterium]|nr:ABC transporter substrate-binding protein [Acidobacteriota bacterium]
MRTVLPIVLAVCLSGCNRSTTTERVREVRVALPRDGITWLPIRLAQTLGYFGEQNLKISVSDAAGLSKAMESLLGGSVEVIGGGLSQTIQVAAEGRSVRSFVLLYTRSTMALAIAPGMTGKIKDVAGLKRHNIGITSPGSVTHQQLNFVLSKHHLSQDDVSVVSIGTGASSLSALERGKVDAAMLVGSALTTFERRNPGAVLLADSRTAEGTRKVFGSDTFPNTVILAQDSWLKANPDTARRFARSVLKAMGWMHTHSAEEVRAQMSESERMPDAEADLQAIRQAQQTLSPDGVMPDPAPELMRKFVAVSSEKVATANIELANIYTNEFVIGK